MQKLSTLMAATIFVAILASVPLIATAGDTDILSAPGSLPVEEEGGAWNHPKATISGVGELEFEDEYGYDVEFEGLIQCDVEVSASAHPENEVEIEGNSVTATEVEAESENASITVNNCSVNGGAIGALYSASFTAAEVKVEISGYDPATGTFDEYEAQGEVENGYEHKVELELENGDVLAGTSGCPCFGATELESLDTTFGQCTDVLPGGLFIFARGTLDEANINFNTQQCQYILRDPIPGGQIIEEVILDTTPEQGGACLDLLQDFAAARGLNCTGFF